MSRYKYPIMEDDQNTPITSFSEGPGVTVTPKEVDEASDEIEQEEEEDQEKNDDGMVDASEYSDEELMSMNGAALAYVRFTPRFEYGTPSGIKPADTRGCPSCGDAADAAIIDAEVEPSEGTVPEEQYAEGDTGGGGDIGGGDEGGFGEEGEEDEDFTFELKQWAYLQKDFDAKYKALEEILNSNRSDFAIRKYCIVAQEDLSAIIGQMATVLGIVLTKTLKYTRKAYLFVRNKINRNILRLDTVSKLWNSKLKSNLDKVRTDRLDRYEVTAFPYDVWLAVVKTGLSIYDTALSGRDIVFNSNTSAVNKRLADLKASLGKIEIEFDIKTSKVNMNELLDKREYRSISSLGFSKEKISNCARYFDDIARCMPAKDKNPLKSIVDAITREIADRTKAVNAKVEKDELKEGSKEYKKEMEEINGYAFRLNFVLICMKTAYALFDLAITDILHIFSKYEDAYASDEMVD